MVVPKMVPPESAIDISLQAPEAADKTMDLDTAIQIPTAGATSEADHSNSAQSEQTEAPTQNATSIAQSKASSKDDETPNDASSASLWCSTTLRSHASLVEWGIVFCNSCKQSLSPPEKKEKPAEENKDNKGEKVIKKEDAAKGVSDNNEPNIVYKTKYLDDSNEVLFVHPWHEQLDLEKERQVMTTVGSGKPVVEVISVVMTDLTEKEVSWTDRDEVFQNIIRNPKVVVDEGGREIVLNSKAALKALRRIITYYPGLQLIGHTLRLVPPYCVYYHHMEEIRAYQLTWTGANGHETRQKHSMEEHDGFTPCDEETYHHLSMLGDVMREQGLETVTEEMTRYQRSPPVATYRMLWLLLKPGITVYANLGGSLAAYVVSSVAFRARGSKSFKKYRVHLWYLDYDGVKLGRCPFYIDVGPFDGERKITQLDVIPCKYYDEEDGGQLRRRLELRGRKYLGLLCGAQVDYEGETLGDQRRWVQGRVIIDPSTYHTYSPSSKYDSEYRADLRPPVVGKINDAVVTRSTGRRWRGESSDSSSPSGSDRGYGKRRYMYRGRYSRQNNVGPWAAYENIIPMEAKLADFDNLEAEETCRHLCLLCPKGVIGFDLTSRRWDILDAELCMEANFNTAAIENLVMPEDKKILLQSLVYRFASSDAIQTGGRVPKSWTADFIQHKGEGQIFLLHGSPGVGKTYTAECIAEATGRPLLSLTAGNIGTNEHLAEETLSKWFRMAEIWGAVMLLDEADVFLEKRVHQDLQRNSLVSIFLRTIEYYRGILFLTTNRVGQFDDAFISRIHVVIRYTNLTAADRKRIWNQFFQKLEDERGEEIKIAETARDYVLENKKMNMIQWNGREIRNAFQTAVTLAEYRFYTSQKKSDRVTLERKDFEKVCSTTDAFKKYLESIPLLDEGQRARLDRDRNDDYKGEDLEEGNVS